MRKALAALFFVFFAHSAYAGNMFLPDRGARPLGRGGAIVAGADDAGSALAYNPAGLADIEGMSLLFDVGLIFQKVQYTRVDSGGNPQPTVNGQNGLLPIPTLAFSWKPKKLKWFTLGVGVFTPYLGLDSYPATGPQRYSLVSLNGSLLLVIEVAAGFQIGEHVRLGVGFQNMYLNFESEKVLSACPSQVDCAPENPNFDSLTQIKATSVFTPSGILGLNVEYQYWRLGVALQLPYFVRASGTVATRLPSDPMFDGSKVVGNQVSLNFNLPLELRVGFELRPTDRFRLEIGADYEAWSMQQSFQIVPHNIYIENVPGVGTYQLKTMYENRGLHDVFALHVGLEGDAVPGRLVLRAGYTLETSATPDSTAALLTPENLRNLISVGLGVYVWKFRFDLGYAHVFTEDRTVPYQASKSYQINPIQPGLGVGVGGGTYKMSDDILALGFDSRF